ADVKRYFLLRKINFNELVENCRDTNKSIPYFENLIGSTWGISSGAKAALVDKKTGEKKVEIQGPGTISLSTYWAHFETAKKAITNSVELSSFSEYQIAIVQGIASIEAYLNHRVELWNKDHPADKLVDTTTNKVSFKDKIDIWLPKMTSGKKLDKSLNYWMHFLELRKVRDHL
ncbi:MAG: hypothetical protein IIB44_08910, partial [Candidatus Marinimicrobia bacterium]|nr:hypothetical protein [Candidatus Neomarinimicrobiota bacterium]